MDSAQRAIVMRFRILRTIVRPPAPGVKVDREKLQNKDTAGAFRAAMARQRKRLTGERGGLAKPRRVTSETCLRKVGGGLAGSWRRRSKGKPLLR